MVEADIEVHTGRKWEASRELQIAEEHLKHKSLVGTVATDLTGLGYHHNPRRHRITDKEHQHLLQKEVRASEEELRLRKTVALGQQGTCMKQENMEKRKVSWSNMKHSNTNFIQIRFLTQAVYDTLLTPANLYTWGKTGNLQCPMCTKKNRITPTYSQWLFQCIG